MYDKLKMWVDGLTERMNLNNLDIKESRYDDRGNLNIIRYSLDNFSIYEYNSGYSVIGSLPKFLYGNNVATLNRADTKRAIEKLSDCLHYDMGKAQVNELEFAANSPMRKPPIIYLRKLGDIEGEQHFTRALMGTTLYYLPKTKIWQKKLTFYDKGEECRTKGVTNPLAGSNLLRYELTLKKGYKSLPTLLGLPSVTASELSDMGVYCKVLAMWQNMYNGITKINKTSIKQDRVMGIKTAADATKLYRAIRYGNVEDIDAFITMLKDYKVFNGNKRSYYKKVRERLIKDISDVINHDDEDIKELNEVINNAGAYA